MNYAKPKPYDYRRPDDADDTPDERLEEALDEIEDGDSDDGELMTDGGCTVRFFDETFPKPEDVYQRVWDFETPPRRFRRSDLTRIQSVSLRSTAPTPLSSCTIRSRNLCVSSCDRYGRRIQMTHVILDNYPSHHAHDVKDFAEELQIQLVFLPKYSPHLNPIEPLWRELKYVLSRVFVTSEDTFQSLIRNTFDRLSTRLSYAQDWIDIFLADSKKLRQ